MHVRCCRSAVVCEENAIQHDTCLSAALLRAALGWMQEARAAAEAEGLRVLSAAPRGHPAALLGWNSPEFCRIV